MSSYQAPVIFDILQRNLKIFDRFSKYPQMTNFVKIIPAGSALLDSDRQTGGRADIMKLIVAFRNFANAPANRAIAP